MILTYRPIDSWHGDLTVDRVSSQFSRGWKSTIELLEREVGHLTGTNTRHWQATAVVQLAVPEGAIRQDGQLIERRKAPEHPGVILSIESERGPMRFACDRFASPWQADWSESWRHNLLAIALGLEALRKVERYGLGTGTEQYVGFQAIGSGRPMGGVEELTRDEAARILIAEADWPGDITPTEVLLDPDVMTALFKRAAVRLHPDRGGDENAFKRIVQARDLLAPKAIG